MPACLRNFAALIFVTVQSCNSILRFPLLLLIVVVGGFCNTAKAANAANGELVEYTLVKTFPIEELKAFFKLHHIPKVVLPVVNGLNIYEVVYQTTYADKSIVKASGLLYVPVGSPDSLPLMVYNHGTEMCRDRSCDFTDEQSIGLAFSTEGYIVVLPDYVGLGKGERNQLYLNAATEAQATVDMLIACKKLLTQLKVKTNKQLFITGYSQGGHAAMATTQLLQKKYKSTLPVTASAPMSGPYNVEKTVFDSRKNKFEFPGFLYLLLISYIESTGDFKQLSNILNAPYDSILPALVYGDYPIDEIDKLLPDTIFKTIKPEFYTAFENDSNSGFRKYLRVNNVFDWKPEMPMQLCYCDKDEEVDFHNSILTYDAMKKNGATSVELWDAGKKFGHINCALFAVVYTKMFFDGFRNGHPGNHGPQFKRLLLNIGKLTVKSR
ncbi:MAG: hypothetical protein JWO06_922 [Bacteroidota bacterium]|nr:hypothetical protein [Bacteroidota bacterium]